MNIVFMGTPDFAVPCLNALLVRGETVSAVFTQPDKPKGRGYKLAPPPVKEVALQHGIPVYQPLSFKKEPDASNAMQALKELSPDLIVVVAYGKLLPRAVLEIPKLFCINVHASLLPLYRGAGPIQWAVLNGEKETGITTMRMAEGLDTGDMLVKKSTPIGKNETASELHDRLAVLGAETLLKTLEKINEGTMVPVPQDDHASSYAPMLTKELCAIDFGKSAQDIHNQIRGLSEWPAATAQLNEKRIKIYKSVLVSGDFHSYRAGEIVKSDNLTVVCGDGQAISILELQADGGKRMSSSDYLRGNKVELGTIMA